MAQQAPIPTVSLAVQGSTRNDPVKTRPKSLPGSKPKLILQPVIPEVETEDDSSEVRISGDNGSAFRTGFTKNTPSRTNSTTSLKSAKTKKANELKGVENDGYDDRSSQQFERDFNGSTRSSVHDSVVSLQVQREQYCCCTRWTRFERKLAISVGVLAGIIFLLAIAVGILAD